MRIGITGSTGLIGWHLKAHLRAREDVELREATRADFANGSALDSFVDGLDAVVHFAGMNRGNDAEVEAVNIGLADALISSFERSGFRSQLLFSSSTHVERDTGYGRAKRECASRFSRWAGRCGAGFLNLVLPNVFGEFGRPHRNSVVSTFCHQLAHGEEPTVLADGQLELLHAQEVAAEVTRILADSRRGEVRMGGERLAVSALLGRLDRMRRDYSANLIPDLRHPLDLQLFNTYRSYLFPDFYPVPVPVHADDRGRLFEAARSQTTGQTYYSVTRPGVTRGNHYHRRKVERFLVADGEALIRVRKLFESDVVEFRVSGDVPQYVDMPTFHTHSITNIGSSGLSTLFWAQEIFDPQDPDTYHEPVAIRQ